MPSAINKQRKYAKWGVLLLAALLSALSSCTTKSSVSETPIDFDNTKYIVTLSQTFKNKAILVCIGSDGEIRQTVPYEGQAINAINRLGNDLYLHSERVNRHLILTEQGTWQEFSYEKNEIEDSEYAGSWFTANGEHGLIQTMNIGLGNGYNSAILYQEQGEQKVIHLKDLIPHSAVEYDGKIYVNADYEHMDAETEESRSVILVIDRQSGVCTTVRFPHDYTAYSGELVLVNDKVVTYGGNEDMLHLCQDKTVYRMLGVLDTKTLETKEFDCTSDEICLLYEHQGQIYTVTKSGNLNIYRDDLTLVQSKKLENLDYLQKCSSDALCLERIIAGGDSLTCLFTNADLDPNDVGLIQEYRKADLQPLQTSKIYLPECKEWMGELSDFVIIE